MTGSQREKAVWSVLHSVHLHVSKAMKAMEKEHEIWNLERKKKWDGGGGMDWIDMAQDRDRWRALVYSVMNLRVP
jgi:hypothetical protein